MRLFKIGEIFMKKLIFIILLVCTTTFAQERKQERYAALAMANLNASTAQLTTLCNVLSDGELKTHCNTQSLEMGKGKIDTILNGLQTDLVSNKSSETLIAQMAEEKCIDKAQKELTRKGQSFDGTETCEELQYALCIFDYTKLLTDAKQTVEAGKTCIELQEQWATYSESINVE